MSIKILLADDSITIQKVIGIIFGGDEYTLTVVDNGRAAIDKARELSPDVLLIDALMPGMSGYEVCEAVRATPALATKPILILTGSFEPFDETKAKSCGADDFLAKPFESQQIISKVKELYELGASRAATQPLTEPIPESPYITVPPIIPQAAPVIARPVVEEQAEDIWGAFTITEEPAPAAPSSVMTESALESDVFAIIGEEPDVQITQPPAAPVTSVNQTGSQWVPVEEHTFDFAEETVVEPPPTVFIDQVPPTTATAFDETAFGDISFEEEPLQAAAPVAAAVEPTPFETPETAVFAAAVPSFTETIIPEFTETVTPEFVVPASINVEPATAANAQPAETAIAATLTEEQLRAAIAGVSQEVIQRIVWEVVPDLAETLIKEAIRKIKEGL